MKIPSNFLTKVADPEFGVSVYRVLCDKCRQSIANRLIRMSDQPCEQCGKPAIQSDNTRNKELP